MSKSTQTEHPGSYASYTGGFILSIILTLAAFFLVENETMSGWTLIYAISVLAVGQLLVQIILFLHLGKEHKPRWNSIAFMFMLLVVVIVVIGSLWIMHNLNYHMETDIDHQLMQEENIYH